MTADNNASERTHAASGERQAIIVAGMHRSGTSAVTRVMNLLGAELPSGLLGANIGNKQGHWESNELISIHDEVLLAANSSWSSVFEIDPSFLKSEQADQCVERIIAFLNRDLANAQMFVIKDPRIAVLLPLWKKALAAIGLSPRIVIPYRHPLEVAASLTRREDPAYTPAVWPQGRGLLLWLRYVLAAERSTRGELRSFVSYDAFLDDWRAETSRIATQIRVEWPNATQATEEAVDGFVSRKHKNERSADGSLLEQASPLACRVFNQLATSDAAPQSGAATFDAASEAMRSSAELFQEYVLAAERRANEAFHLEADLKQAKQEIAKLEDLIRAMQDSASAANSERHSANPFRRLLGLRS